jgi:hypothetical protein
MASTATLTPTEKFTRMVNSGDKVGVSEFSRSKAWRTKLRKSGCFEVVDRGETVGYMLSPEYATEISEKVTGYDELVDQAEYESIAAMFKARESYTDIKTGKELQDAAEAYFDKNIDCLMEVVNGN